MRHRPLESNDPWDARTLEWMTSSPPPVYNFDEIPAVHSLDEFWHRKYAEDKSGRLVPVQAGAADRRSPTSRTATAHAIHLPSPSYWPIVAALGLPIMAYGVIYSWWLVGPRRGGHARRCLRMGPRALGGGVAMADVAITKGHDEHETTTGLPHTKLAMWLFLSSECLLFGALITTYVLYRNASIKGPYPSDVFDIGYTSVSSFVLLASSLTMVLALAAAQKRDFMRMRLWLVTTAMLGLTFVGGQVYEFTALLPGGPGHHHQPVRHDVLRPDRLPRRPRHRRHPDVAVAHGDVVRGSAPRGSRRSPWRWWVCTGTSSTSCGSSSSRWCT